MLHRLARDAALQSEQAGNWQGVKGEPRAGKLSGCQVGGPLVGSTMKQGINQLSSFSVILPVYRAVLIGLAFHHFSSFILLSNFQPAAAASWTPGNEKAICCCCIYHFAISPMTFLLPSFHLISSTHLSLSWSWHSIPDIAVPYQC